MRRGREASQLRLRGAAGGRRGAFHESQPRRGYRRIVPLALPPTHVARRQNILSCGARGRDASSKCLLEDRQLGVSPKEKIKIQPVSVFASLDEAAFASLDEWNFARTPR